MAKRVWWLRAAALALAGLFTACTPFSQGTQNVNIAGVSPEDFIEPEEPEQIITGLSLSAALQGTITTLDPALCDSFTEYTLAAHLFEGLYAYRDSGGTPTLMPAAATGCTLALGQDGTATYTFTLRGDAQWHDGVQLTAGDFEYAWKRLAESLPGSTSCGPLQGIVNAEQIRLGELPPSALAVNATDDFTLQVTLLAEDDTFPERTSLPTLYPVRQDTVERAEYDWSLTGPFFCGNGTYTLAGRDNSQIVLHHRDEDTAAPTQITFYLTDGEDPADITPDLRATAGGPGSTTNTGWQTHITVEKAEQNGTAGEALTEALALALDTRLLATQTTLLATPHSEAAAQDTEAATAALAQAGYPEGAGWPEGTVLLHTTGSESRALAEAIAATWQQTLGITVETRSLEPTDPDSHPLILRLVRTHQSQLPAAQGDIAGQDPPAASIPLLAEQLTYSQSADLTHLVYTQSSSFYLGDCTLGEDEEIPE